MKRCTAEDVVSTWFLSPAAPAVARCSWLLLLLLLLCAPGLAQRC